MARLVPRRQLEAETRRIHAEARRIREKFRSAMRLVEDHFPISWPKVRDCRMGRPLVRASEDFPDHYKVVPAGCHEIPFCILCSKAEHNRRLWQALIEFSRCTPRGKPLRAIHVVQTAPIYHRGPPNTWPEGDEGWGFQASLDRTRFRQIVFDALVEHLGSGIGAKMSYQDFGEEAFLKRHPHLDFTLNGYMIQDGQAALTPQLDLTQGGKDRWEDGIAARATTFRIDAKRGNAKFGRLRVGVQDVQPVLKYQTRELVDFRKVDYSRDQRAVYWLSYRDHRRHKHTVPEFIGGLAEYQYRLGVFGEQQRHELHVSLGHLAKRRINRTETLFDGAELPHGRRCICSQCSDWYYVDSDEQDQDPDFPN